MLAKSKFSLLHFNLIPEDSNTRFPIFSEIKCIIDAFGSHLHVDLQQRSVEFSQLFKTHSNLRPALLEKMPPMQITRVSSQNNDLNEDNSILLENGIEENDSSKLTNKVPNSDSVSMHCIDLSIRSVTKSTFYPQNALLDLLGGTDVSINMMSPTMNPSEKAIASTETIPNNQDLLDLLGGLDLSTPTTPVVPTTANNLVNSNSNGNNILSMMPSVTSPSFGGNLLDNLTNNSTSNVASTAGVKLTALDKNGLNVILVPQKNVGGDGNGCLRVIMSATNNTMNTLEQYLFQAAVPKSFTLQMLSPSGSVLPPGGTITQEMRLTNSAKVSVYTRINQRVYMLIANPNYIIFRFS